MDDARATFAEGERVLRQVGAPFRLARLLCGRVRLASAEGQLADARALLGEAEALGAELAVAADSELGKALAEARTAVRTR